MDGVLLEHRGMGALEGVDFSGVEGFTVEVWCRSERGTGDAGQVLAAQWALRQGMDAFEGYDAGDTAGLNTKGYFGAVCDGRYVYFAPQFNGDERHGNALRYDTHGAFGDGASWEAYDAGGTDGLVTRGYYGAVHAPPYVFYVPRTDGERFHTRLLRYDTRQNFDETSAWRARDLGHAISYQSAAFDGRFIYFAPGYEADSGPSGKVLRYDTRCELDADDFASDKACALYDAAGTDGLDAVCYDGAVYDGRYVYFAPLNDRGVVLRCDTAGDFEDAASWQAVKAGGLAGVEMGMCVGAVYDGRHVYFVPYSGTAAVRYDTRGDFEDTASWQGRDIAGISGLKTMGYDGALFDGRYVYYIPFWDGEDGQRGFHNRLLRYDTVQEYGDDAAWCAVDAGALTRPAHPGGFNGGAFDGRFLYMAPWREDPASGDERDYTPHGKVLRCDTAAPGSVFALKYDECGHNGGLGAALPGAVFYVNTLDGVRAARSNAVLKPGWHHLAGVWDGAWARLYLDGEEVAAVEASALATGVAPLGIGQFAGGGSAFAGDIGWVRIAGAARSADWVVERAASLLG